MPAGRFWTTHEIKIAMELRQGEATYAAIGKHLGRSCGSVSTLLRDIRNPKKRVAERAVRIEKEEHFEPAEGDEVWGSECLRVAILTSLMRYANDNEIDIDTAAYRLLSKGVA